MAIARLAVNAVERLRLFRLRQGRLRQWARKIMPAGVMATPPARPAPAERITALRDHAAISLHLVQAMEARHVAERQGERAARAALQRQAAQNWQHEAAKAQASATVARYTGYGVAHWQAAQQIEANDNRPALPPPRPRPF